MPIITQSRSAAVVIDDEKCIAEKGCRVCVDVCPLDILAIVAKGDEVLDWREMTARYAHGPLKLIAGSDHGLADFEQHVPDLLRHLGL